MAVGDTRTTPEGAFDYLLDNVFKDDDAFHDVCN
jgi:hypothetical protein